MGSYDDPIKAWETWKKLFMQIADKHGPIEKRRLRKISAPWLTAEIKNLMWERDHLKPKAVITKDESDWVNFKTKKNLVNYKIRNSKQQYYNSYLSNNVGRTKETWYSKGHVTRCNFSCNLQCNSTLDHEICKITKYES